MLRRTLCNLNWRASTEFDRARTLLRGRARLERKIGVKQILFLFRTQTKYRVEMKHFWERAIVRKNVDSAAHEHGSGWVHIRNDLARQNVMLLPRAQQMLAQYEPLSFRAVMELCASRIPPLPPPLTAQVPEEAYARLTSTCTHKYHNGQGNESTICTSSTPSLENEEEKESECEEDELKLAHPAARRELREGIARMLRASPHGVLNDYGPKDMTSWMEVWREYDVDRVSSFVGIDKNNNNEKRSINSSDNKELDNNGTRSNQAMRTNS